MATKAIDNYSWVDLDEIGLDTEMVKRAKTILDRCKTTWHDGWVSMLQTDMKKGFGHRMPSQDTSKLFADIYSRVLKDFGFDPYERTVGGVGGETVFGIDPDQQIIALAEAKRRYAPLQAVMRALAADSGLACWMDKHPLRRYFFENESEHLERCDVQTLMHYCTYKVPEKNRALLDFAVENKAILCELLLANKTDADLESFLKWLSTNEPTAQNYCRWLKIRF